jgi:23S rRNA (cytidine2498-2'-O)-methyltransferase
MNFIASAHPESLSLAAAELGKLAIYSKTICPHALECEWVEPFAEASGKIRASGAVFVSYLAPIEIRLPRGGPDDGIAAITAAALELLERHGQRKSPVSVHLFSLGASDQGLGRTVGKELAERLRADGVSIERKAPSFLVTVGVTEEEYLVGACGVEAALSSWPLGQARYRLDDAQSVSRAEGKLVEALDTLPFSPALECSVIDLGASPGGWTRVLAERGHRVEAVDPAELDAGVTRMRGVTHHRMAADRFIGEARGRGLRFGALVNDMRMDPVESAQLVDEAAAILSPNAAVLMTLKLKLESRPEEIFGVISQAKEILSRRYELQGARQLFSNRSEVTVALKRKGS